MRFSPSTRALRPALPLLPLLFMLSAGAARPARAPQEGCPAGSVELGRETVGDEIRLYCGTRRDKEKLDQLMSAIRDAAASPPCIGSDRCNIFAGRIAKSLGIPYFRDIEGDRSPDGRLANEIYGFLEKAVRSKPSGWRQVSEEEAQQLANSGKFVIGVARHKDPSPVHHGHLAIVAPSADGQMEKDGVDGRGPWVRDNQHPDQSVRASYSFGRPETRSVVDPIYVVWEGGGSKN